MSATRYTPALAAIFFASLLSAHRAHALANGTAAALAPPDRVVSPPAKWTPDAPRRGEPASPRGPAPRELRPHEVWRERPAERRGAKNVEAAILDAVRDVVGDLTPEQRERLQARMRELMRERPRREARERIERRDDRPRRGPGRGPDAPGFGFYRDGGRAEDARMGGPCCPDCRCAMRSDNAPAQRRRWGRGRGSGEDAAAPFRSPRRGGGRRFERGGRLFRDDSRESVRDGRPGARFFDRFDADDDGVVARDEFPGRPGRFDRLDRNKDDRIDKSDFHGRDRPRRDAPPPPPAREGLRDDDERDDD